MSTDTNHFSNFKGVLVLLSEYNEVVRYDNIDPHPGDVFRYTGVMDDAQVNPRDLLVFVGYASTSTVYWKNAHTDAIFEADAGGTAKLVKVELSH